MNEIRFSMKLPNEESIRASLEKKVEDTLNQTKEFCQEVRLLNLTLLDERLETRSGTLRTLMELGNYSDLMDEGKLPFYNKATDKQGYAKVFFEV